jgi:hypothetical protein
MADQEEWCSINEAARRLGVTPTAIRNRIKRGTLEHRPNGNVGKLVRVPSTATLTVPKPVPLTVNPPVPFTGQTVGGTVAPLTDRAGPPGATFCPLCSEHLGGTRAPAAGRGGGPVGSQRRASASTGVDPGCGGPWGWEPSDE